MPMPAQPDFAALSLDAIAAFARDRRLPPVDRWHPAHCGDSEMRIAADGTWFHHGSPNNRPELLRLFPTILRRAPDGGSVLVTPPAKPGNGLISEETRLRTRECSTFRFGWSRNT